MRIRQLNITGVRGIPALSMDVQGKNVVIYGENGSGKSSIVDALEFFFTGGVSHLDGVQDLSFKHHGPNINYKFEDMKVEVTLNSGNHVTRTTKSLLGITADLKEHFELLENETFVLRRSQILRFIADPPAGKYDALAKLIGTKKMDDIALVFQRACKHYENEVTTRNNERSRLLRGLSQRLNGRVLRADDAIQLLNPSLEQAGFRPVSSIYELGNFIACNQVNEKDGIPPKMVAINQLLKAIPDYVIPPETITNLNELKEQLDPLIGTSFAGDVKVSNLLEIGMEILGTRDDKICPLCGQEIEPDALLIRLAERAQQIELSKKKLDSITSLATTITVELDKAVNRLNALLKEGRNHEEFARWNQTIVKAVRTISENKAAIEGLNQGFVNLNFDGLLAENATLQAILRDIKQTMSTLAQNVTPSVEQLRRYNTLILVGKVIEIIRNIERCEEEAARLARLYGVSDKIFQTYVKCKHDVVQGVYDSLQDDIARFYSTLHPGEQPNNINLEVDKNKRASAGLRIDYFKRVDDPRAYLSEGHLDSLGLCILLAFIKKYNRNCPIIVLDDIVTTIDAGHRERVCGLVYSEFKKSQVFITTHDGIWKQQLVSYDQAYGANILCLEIVNNDPVFGPIIQGTRSSWQMVEDCFGGEKSRIGNEGRKYLEEVLKKICIQLRASVTYKGPSYPYNIQELLDAAKTRAEKKLDKAYFERELQPKFQALNSNKFVANLASHHNEENHDLSHDELKRFCEAVHALDLAFDCHSCHKQLTYSDDYKMLYCANPGCAAPHKIHFK